MKRHRIDALGIFLLPGQVSRFYLQASQLGFQIPTFGTDVFESRKEIFDSNKLMEGALFTNLDVSEWFRSKYIEEYGNDTQISYAGQSFDFATLVSELFHNNATSLSANDVLFRVKALKERRGVAGKFFFNPTENNFVFDVKLKEIRNGNFVTLRG